MQRAVRRDDQAVTPRCGGVELDASLPGALRALLRPESAASGVELPAAAARAVDAADPQFRLLQSRDGLQLLALAAPELGVLHIDLLRGSAGWRSGARARGERLVRACGVLRRSAGPPCIVDGTGGLGTDSWLLASAGATVITCEQHPVLAALLRDALQRAAPDAPEVAARMRVLQGDVRAQLPRLDADVLYLDPMYPPRRKAALGDRRLRLVAALLAADGYVADDAAGLVRTGLACGIPRVVLKRPKHAEVEVARAPNHALEGRSTRFDVWLSAPASPPLHAS